MLSKVTIFVTFHGVSFKGKKKRLKSTNRVHPKEEDVQNSVYSMSASKELKGCFLKV